MGEGRLNSKGILLTFFPWKGRRNLSEGGGLFERGCLIEESRYALISLSSPSVVTILEIFSYGDISMYIIYRTLCRQQLTEVLQVKSFIPGIEGCWPTTWTLIWPQHKRTTEHSPSKLQYCIWFHEACLVGNHPEIALTLHWENVWWKVKIIACLTNTWIELF